MPERKPGTEPFLARWSRRKLEAARAPAEPLPGAGAAALAPPAAATAALAPSAAAPATTAATETPALPPVESLSFDSDFTAFLQPGVDHTVQRAALRKLLRDARFNVMDGLDVYIDDYTKPSPLDAAVVKDLAQARYLFAPRTTRVTAEGVVEDVPVAADGNDAEGVEDVPVAADGNDAAGDAAPLEARLDPRLRAGDAPAASPPGIPPSDPANGEP